MANRLAVGNWKMNTTLDEALSLVGGLASALKAAPVENVGVGVAPPFPFLEPVGRAIKESGAAIALVAQDCHAEPKGAFTSAVSVPMLASVGVTHVIVGHSERRKHFGDDDACVRAKLEAVLAAGLVPIVCVGETLEQRESGQAEAVVGGQVRAALEGVDLSTVVVAYEPVWAIGTGKTASPAEAGAMHTYLREQVLSEIAAGKPVPLVLYGGSVKPANIDSLAATPHIGGVLVGGASLEASSFAQIVQGCANNGSE